jgi:DNA-binding MarR family transcriptional regulator
MVRSVVETAESEDFLRLLRLTYWKVISRLDDRLGESGLTARQTLFLATLEDLGPCNSHSVCKALFVTPADVTGLADRLEEKHFLKRARAPVDRRQVILEITAEGREALQRALKRRAQVTGEILGRVPPKERKTMLETLRSVLARLDELPPGHAAAQNGTDGTELRQQRRGAP